VNREASYKKKNCNKERLDLRQAQVTAASECQPLDGDRTTRISNLSEYLKYKLISEPSDLHPTTEIVTARNIRNSSSCFVWTGLSFSQRGSN